MSSLPETSPQEKSAVRRFTEIVGTAVVLSCLLLLMFVWKNPLKPTGGLEVGKGISSIHAAGWINGYGIDPELLNGKVIVINAWASWCRPCLAHAPELIEIYEEFEGREVVFIGLTAEGEVMLPEIMKFIERTGIPWMIGYGAIETLQQLKADVIPAVWVIGTDGLVAWNNDSPGTLSEAIEKALERAGSE